ncbi:glycosyltransferase [Naumannella halotolerans]|uniref:Glycosyltransferase involved in cell wall biosynthesis n=1 Tax=Naumannella halotolerans TaxID=993414 RepID=A0A4R7J8T4_9ACTN|nr:glycosyltransferase [Naumannella halotolerans]TDT33921.1 glycosyltransferase involved in cell wall biosynthesis [Naumannella halotolerans]
MRILIGTDTYPPTVNGAAQFSRRLAGGLSRRGHEVHVLCPAQTTRSVTTTEPSGVTVHQIGSFPYPPYETFRISRPTAVGPAAGRLLDRLQPEVVHVQDHFLIGRALIRRAASRGIGVVATNHMMAENYFDHVPCPRRLRGIGARWLWADLRRVFARTSVITSPTPKAAELLTRATGLPAVAVSNGIDSERYERARDRAVRPATPTVLFVGRLDPEKRIDDLLRAMALLPEQVPGRLVVVGHGSQRAALRNLAAELGLGADRLEFSGYVDETELLTAYGSAEVFCMPGVAELQSLATLEAMSARLPVVAADAMALPHLVREGENGWLYPPGQVETLAARLTAILSDAETRRLMGKKSSEIVAEHAFGATLDRFEQLYTTVR